MSKFSGLTAHRKKPEEAVPNSLSTEVLTTQKSEIPELQKSGYPETQLLESPEDLRVVRRGRPRAKRSDPNYMQVTAYVRKDTYRAIKSILFNHEGEREFSDLVETLLKEYVNSRT